MTREKLKNNTRTANTEPGAAVNNYDTGWDGLTGEPMPKRPASKWDILKKIPFAGAIYEHKVQKKELARQTTRLAEQNEKHAAEISALNAEQERLEQEHIEQQRTIEEEQARIKQQLADEQFIQAMDSWRVNHSATYRAQNERRQEIAERAFNDALTPVDLIAAEAMAGSPEVTASTTEYEAKTIPVYTLRGRELKCFIHAINFKGQGGQIDSNRIGTATAARLQDDPSFWDKGRDEVMARINDKQETHDNASSVSSSLSVTFLDTNRNFSQVNRRSGIWDYGFSHLAPGSIINISVGDGAFAQGQDSRQVPPELRDHLLTPEQVSASIGKTYHNEFYLNRYDQDGKALKPDFLLTSSSDGSYIPDIVKKHAAYFNVPIFSIDQSAYRNKERARLSELANSLSDDQSYEDMIKTLDAIDDSPAAEWAPVKNDRYIGHADRDQFIKQQVSLPDTIPHERQEKLFAIELAKKLDFIKRRLTETTADIRRATESGQIYDWRNNDILSAKHCDTIHSPSGINQAPDLPTEAAPGHHAIVDDYRHRLDIKIKLNGLAREYSIRDGKHPAKTEYVSPTSPDTPDYYTEFAPLVDNYLAALEENSHI